MNPDTTFERELQGWLAAEAPASGPAGLHDMVLERVRTTRQRPSWLVSLRGGAFPSPARTIGRPAARLTYLLVVLGLVLALIAVAIAAGALRSRPVRVPGWTSTGSMIEALDGGTATVLLNGKVLVTGGFTGTGDGLASAELYDPASGTWTATGGLGGSATLLLDGRVLVAGGGRDDTSAELYDPGTGSSTATGTMIAWRAVRTATLLPDGRVLVAGGTYDATSPTALTAELYDPAGGTWTATGSMGGSCCGTSATLLLDGRVLSAGGGRNHTSAELYDPASGTWTATGSMVTQHLYQVKATLLSNGKVLVAGGSDVNYDPLASAELYDPTTGSWTATGKMITPRAEFSATMLRDGKVLVAGGRDRSLESGSVPSLASAELYDPVSGTWTATEAMITPRDGHTATLLPDGRVLVAGGLGNRSTGGDDLPMASAELYDPGSP